MARGSSKPYRTVIYFSGHQTLQDKLDALGVIYTCRDVLSTFWGKEYEIYKPRGKGTVAKCKAIDEILDPTAKW